MDYGKFQSLVRKIVGDQPVNLVARQMGVPVPMLLFFLTQGPVDAIPEGFLQRLCMLTPGKVSLLELAEAAGWHLTTGVPAAKAYGADFPTRALFNAQMWQACAVDPRVAGVEWNSLKEMVDFFVYVGSTEHILKYELSDVMPYSGKRHQPAPYFAYVKLYYDIEDIHLSQTVFMYIMRDKTGKVILMEFGFLVADILDNGFKITGGNGLQPKYPAVQVLREKSVQDEVKTGKINDFMGDDAEPVEAPKADEIEVNQPNHDRMFVTTFEGFGFEIYDEPNAVERLRLIQFLHMHQATLKHLISGEFSLDTEEHIRSLFNYADEETMCVGIGSVIAAIMCWETNIHFVFFRDMEGKFQQNRSCVMVLDSKWDEKLADIVYQYASELGLATFGPCYFAVEMEKDDPFRTDMYRKES